MITLPVLHCLFFGHRFHAELGDGPPRLLGTLFGHPIHLSYPVIVGWQCHRCGARR